MFDTCPTLDNTSCPNCISGSPGCENIEDGTYHYATRRNNLHNHLFSFLGYFVMAIGGYYYDGGSVYLDDVELVSLDPDLHPVPDCLTQLNPLPTPVDLVAGALDYSRK